MLTECARFCARRFWNINIIALSEAGSFMIGVVGLLIYLMFLSDRQNNPCGLLCSFRVADQNVGYALLIEDLRYFPTIYAV